MVEKAVLLAKGGVLGDADDVVGEDVDGGVADEGGGFESD